MTNTELTNLITELEQLSSDVAWGRVSAGDASAQLNRIVDRLKEIRGD